MYDHLDDDWSKVEDIQHRRRIQNRLAQRKRRSRLRDRDESSSASQSEGRSHSLSISRPKSYERPSPARRQSSAVIASSYHTSMQSLPQVSMSPEPHYGSMSNTAPLYRDDFMNDFLADQSELAPLPNNLICATTEHINPIMTESLDPSLTIFNMDSLLQEDYQFQETSDPLTSMNMDHYFTSPSELDSSATSYLDSRSSSLYQHSESSATSAGSSRKVEASVWPLDQQINDLKELENDVLGKLETRINGSISGLRKLYDSGICLDLLREDKKLYDDLDHMRQRLLSLIETQQGQLQLSQILAGQGLSAA